VEVLGYRAQRPSRVYFTIVFSWSMFDCASFAF
jgi:hypothetical protein